MSQFRRRSEEIAPELVLRSCEKPDDGEQPGAVGRHSRVRVVPIEALYRVPFKVLHYPPGGCPSKTSNMT